MVNGYKIGCYSKSNSGKKDGDIQGDFHRGSFTHLLLGLTIAFGLGLCFGALLYAALLASPH